MGSQLCFAFIKAHVFITQIMSIIDRLPHRQRISPVFKLLFKKPLNTLLQSQGFTHANTPLNSFNSLFFLLIYLPAFQMDHQLPTIASNSLCIVCLKQR